MWCPHFLVVPEKAKTISSDYPPNWIKNRYRKKANSYNIIYTNLH